MKKILMLLVTLFLFAGCSNLTAKNEENTDLRIADISTSIGGVGETFEKQKLNYEITIINKKNISIIDDSIETVLIDWINEKLIEQEITEKRFDEDKIIVKGYVIFESKDLTKKDIIENEPFINGIKIRTKNDEEVLIKHKFN
ncbi:hypothetical protein [Solibacillus sp. CAU 1738]|uniref:hypothetical protein n=1 Tax=Solibacillus sp. CAU 1738 TaxID=3140363 RepID=UPI0032602B01